MLVNPELKELNVDDLNQRYSETYVRYDNLIIPVDRFEYDRDERILMRTNGKVQKFDWEKLDTYRPPPRYVRIRDNIAWIYYINRRQWKRGFSPDNWDKHIVTGGVGIKTENFLEELYNPLENKKIDLTRTSTVPPVLLSKHMLFINNDIYYRNIFIGSIVDRKLHLHHKHMKEEVLTHIEGLRHE